MTVTDAGIDDDNVDDEGEFGVAPAGGAGLARVSRTGREPTCAAPGTAWGAGGVAGKIAVPVAPVGSWSATAAGVCRACDVEGASVEAFLPGTDRVAGRGPEDQICASGNRLLVTAEAAAISKGEATSSEAVITTATPAGTPVDQRTDLNRRLTDALPTFNGPSTDGPGTNEHGVRRGSKPHWVQPQPGEGRESRIGLNIT